MANLKGNDVLLYIKYNGSFKVVSCLINNPLTEDVEVIETTARGSNGWRSYIGGIQDYSISFDANMVVGNGMVSYEDIKQLKRDLIVFEWRLRSLDGVISDKGTSFISSLSLNNSVNDIVSFSATLTPSTGGINKFALIWSEDGFNAVTENGINIVKV